MQKNKDIILKKDNKMSKKKKIIISVVGFILTIGFLVARNSYLEFQEKRHQERMDNYGDTLIQDWQNSNRHSY